MENCKLPLVLIFRAKPTSLRFNGKGFQKKKEGKERETSFLRVFFDGVLNKNYPQRDDELNLLRWILYHRMAREAQQLTHEPHRFERRNRQHLAVYRQY